MRKVKESWGDQNQILICRCLAGRDCETIYTVYEKEKHNVQFGLGKHTSYQTTDPVLHTETY